MGHSQINIKNQPFWQNIPPPQIANQNSKFKNPADYILRPNLYFTDPPFAPMMQQPRKENYGSD
jgi:hypothetical protein